MTTTEALPGAEPCPGTLTWSAFGAWYPDSVCSSALDWSEAGYKPEGILCDADDDFRPKDVPCPFCAPESFVSWLWGEPDEFVMIWASDESPVADGTVIHFHNGKALWWTATHPIRGEERVLVRSLNGEDDD